MLTGTRSPRARRLAIRTDFLVMWATALIGAGVLRDSGHADFERFIGAVSPVVVVAAAGAVGSAALVMLESAGWVGSDPARRGLIRSTVIAGGLAAAIIIADSTLGFGESINVSWPASILFYPVMAFVAEVVFHVIPLALVSVASRRPRLGRTGLFNTAAPLFIVALVEATYQVMGSSSGETSAWLMAYLAVHMTVFGFAALSALRRSGFGAMMWFRLVYYAIWHVAWGVLRLDVLF